MTRPVIRTTSPACLPAITTALARSTVGTTWVGKWPTAIRAMACLPMATATESSTPPITCYGEKSWAQACRRPLRPRVATRSQMSPCLSRSHLVTRLSPQRSQMDWSQVFPRRMLSLKKSIVHRLTFPNVSVPPLDPGILRNRMLQIATSLHSQSHSRDKRRVVEYWSRRMQALIEHRGRNRNGPKLWI